MVDTSKLYTKTREAFDRRNYDYAVDLSKQILELDPAHPKARQILRTSTLKSYEMKGKVPSGILPVLTGLIPLISLFINKTITKNPEKIIKAGESYLAKNPTSTSARIAVGNALKQLEYLDSALGEFEGILGLNPRNITALKAAGELYHLKGDIKKAQQYYQTALPISPQDPDIPKALKELAATTTIQSSGWTEARSSRDMIKDKKTSVELERTSRIIKEKADIDTEIKRLNELVNQNPQDPQNVKHLKKIGELYLKKKDHPAAAQAYQKALQLTPSDASLSVKLGDIKLSQMEQKIKKLQQKLAANPDNAQLKQDLLKTRQERVRFQIAEYRRRVKLYPTDLLLRYQLGTALYAGGSVDEAIAEFQAAVRDPKRKLASLNYLGRAFLYKKHYDLAITQFTKALEIEALTTGQSKELSYNLASTYEQQGDLPRALEEYKKIMELDITYKDVAKKIEQLQKTNK